MSRVSPHPNFCTFAAKALLSVIGAEMLLLPLWFTPVREISIWLPIGELLMTALIAPMWLCVIAITFVNKTTPDVWAGVIFVVVIGIAMSALIDYASWALSVGSLLHPDAETVLVVEFKAEIASLVGVTPVVAAMAIRALRTHRRSRP